MSFALSIAALAWADHGRSRSKGMQTSIRAFSRKAGSSGTRSQLTKAQTDHPPSITKGGCGNATAKPGGMNLSVSSMVIRMFSMPARLSLRLHLPARCHERAAPASASAVPTT